MFADSKVEQVSFAGTSLNAVINTKNMFKDCAQMTIANFTGLSTTAALTNVSYMFKGCSNLVTADVSGLNTTQVTDASHMFETCSSLTTLTVIPAGGGESAFKFAGNVTTFASMFNGCESLTGLDLREFRACTAVTSMEMMFKNCKNLDYIDLSNFETGSLQYIKGMFNYTGCASSAFDGNWRLNHGCRVFAKGTWTTASSVSTDDSTYDWFRVNMYGRTYKNSNTVAGAWSKSDVRHLSITEYYPNGDHTIKDRNDNNTRVTYGYFNQAYETNSEGELVHTQTYCDWADTVYGPGNY